MRLLALLALLATGPFVGCLLAAPVPKAKPNLKDEEDILGTWKVEAVNIGVEGVPLPDGQGWAWVTFEKGGRVATIGPSGQTTRGTFQLDPTATPKTLDIITTAEGNDSADLYKSDGDTLTIAYGDGGKKTRLAEMKADAKAGVSVLTLKREKDEKMEEPKQDK